MAERDPKIPDCIQLEDHACPFARLSAISSTDGNFARFDFEDKFGQVFPIAMSGTDLANLLAMIGVISERMGARQKEMAGDAQVQIMTGINGLDLPPIKIALSWSPTTEKLTFVVGNVGIQVPMDADSAMDIGEGLIQAASPHSSDRKGLKH